MTKQILTLMLLLTPAGLVRAASDNPAATRTPVLLELFTSEGCSSCPPADRVLEAFDKQQPIAGADLIVISEHVDYWNHLGWSDPFSSPFYSARQRDYSTHLGTPEVYTPQLVIDGHAELVGSDRDAALTAIQKGLETPKLAITVQAPQRGALHIDALAQTAAQNDSHKYDLYLVLASDHMTSQVQRGENAGRTLTHVAVAYSFKKIGTWNTSDALNRDVPVSLKSAGTRAIVFLQDPRTAQIAGVAQTRITSR